MKVLFNNLTVIIAGLMISVSSVGQLVDGTSTFTKTDSSHFIRLHYDNDFFAGHDYYYTQGITAEYGDPHLKNFLPDKLLLNPRNAVTNYNMAYHLFGYTPTSIASDAILFGDRPFAGCMSLAFRAIATDAAQQLRLASSFSLGIIGPAALGKEIQVLIHRNTGNPIPKGWQHQIRNDVIINYQVNAEKRILGGEGLLINGAGEIRLGTLQTKIAAGLNLMAGHFNNPYTGGKKKTSWYVYGQARANAVGYDASLQGGLFNRKSPYTISSGDVTRATFQADGGIVLKLGRLYFGYNRSFLTKEFKTGKEHQWGGVSFAFTW